MHAVKVVTKNFILVWLVLVICPNLFAGELGMAPDPGLENYEVKKTQASVAAPPAVNQEHTLETAILNEGASDEALRLLADIRVHSAKELAQMLERVDQLYLQSSTQPERFEPVVFLLHGEEARTLFKSNYLKHKAVVDLAARLSAFGVVDIKVCERWADNKGLDVGSLQPFVTTVPFAPEEQRRLLNEQGYVYF